MNIEIERKWLIGSFPDLTPLRETEMEQGYLVFEPTSVRIRKAVCGQEADYRLTVKGEGTIARAEVEVDLTAAQYTALREFLAAPVATKHHRTYQLPGDETLECNLVDEGQEGEFYYAEVEFESLEEAKAFKPPAFLGREVTEEPGWTMAAHCRRKETRQNSCAFSAVLLEGLIEN